MKKTLLIAFSVASALGLSAQSAMDAFTASESQLRGTARYVSMGGAFGALGGDLSTLTQNPAGLGVYRSSEFGATLDIDFHNATMDNTGSRPEKKSSTTAACNNFGYAGSMRINSSVMPYFAWGATYNRLNSFDRRYQGYFPSIQTSWSNYVASFSGDYSMNDLWGDENYDPFFQSNVPWISALAYNSFLMNPNPNGDGYVGLFQNGSFGDASIEVREQGYIDEYSINFGGNFSNMVYWGIGLGIRDINYRLSSYYDEIIENALVPESAETTNLTTGKAEWGIENSQQVSGSGFNLKLGLIFKPVNEFRLGLAVHTPTWYNLSYNTNAWIDYGLGKIENDGYYTLDSMVDDNPYATTGNGTWDMKLKSPWRLMVSAAGVLGGRFIISADYVYEAYQNMAFSDNMGELTDISNDIKRYYQPSNEFRLGAEFRMTPSWSVRAGYNYRGAASKEAARNGFDYLYTTGTQSMAEFKSDRNSVSVGLGYRTGGFYIDAAYVYSTQSSNWFAYSSFPSASYGSYELANNALTAPSATIKTNHNNLVISAGFKF
ncbi:MAG: outer membrane protein transport protein [Muribaculaceae bacterium]|nr:outer membrane protein transport protein [Muribaculaceae bacterium]